MEAVTDLEKLFEESVEELGELLMNLRQFRGDTFGWLERR